MFYLYNNLICRNPKVLYDSSTCSTAENNDNVEYQADLYYQINDIVLKLTFILPKEQDYYINMYSKFFSVFIMAIDTLDFQNFKNLFTFKADLELIKQNIEALIELKQIKLKEPLHTINVAFNEDMLHT